LLVVILVVNLIAWMQAWAMTHYSPTGTRTPKPEELSLAERLVTIVTGVNVPRPRNDYTPSDVGLRYETRTIPTPDSGMLEAWYIPAASPAGLVLMFTGYAEAKDTLLTQAASIHEMGYDALLVDFRGAGGSSGSDTTLGVRESKDVAIAADYAQSQWPGRPIVLYGVSMGGAALLRSVALEGVRPDAVIIESPFDSLLSTVGNRFNTMGLPSFPAAHLLVLWGSVQQGFNGFAHNPVDYARSVRCPALLLYGETDPRVNVQQSRSIYDALGGYKEQIEFAGAGHESLVASDARLWNESVARFLRHSVQK
jgi:alpha-beta hydrolase superfamily lysophospholipase